MVTAPAVSVLMATFNGRQWLPAQVDSVLAQAAVTVRLVVSDDGSTDGTWEWLQELAAGDDRVTLLDRGAPTGSARANFYRLIESHELSSSDYVALSDQDDVWIPGKLAAQVELLGAGGLDAVSSDVTTFDAAGHRHLLRKSNPQRRFDYLFESAGPGSTFVLTPRLVGVVQDQLRNSSGLASSVEAHDWLIYAICRAAGMNWFIEPTSWVDYRQHDDNELGANKGLSSAMWRLRKIRDGWHRSQVLAVTDVALSLSHDSYVMALRESLATKGMAARYNLLKHVGEFRRHPRDRAALATLIATGLW